MKTARDTRDASAPSPEPRSSSGFRRAVKVPIAGRDSFRPPSDSTPTIEVPSLAPAAAEAALAGPLPPEPDSDRTLAVDEGWLDELAAAATRSDPPPPPPLSRPIAFERPHHLPPAPIMVAPIVTPRPTSRSAWTVLGLVLVGLFSTAMKIASGAAVVHAVSAVLEASRSW